MNDVTTKGMFQSEVSWSVSHQTFKTKISFKRSFEIILYKVLESSS